MKKISGRKALIFVGISFALFILVAVATKQITGSSIYVEREPVYLSYDNLPSYIAGMNIVDELPRGAKISIYFGEDAYSIVGNEIKKGEIENPDIKVGVPSSYLNREWYGVCSMLKNANQNGDMVIRTELKTVDLMWKYRNLLKYRTCLGV